MIGAIAQNTVSTSITTVTKSVTTSVGSGKACGGASCGDRADISGPGKLFAALKQLASQDPAKFKQVAADIASKLKTAAGVEPGDNSTGTAAAGATAGSFLAQLADKFQTASETGDPSGLQPPSGGRRHPGGHPGGGSVQGTYNQQGLSVPSVGAPPTPRASNGVDLKALFDDIIQEVTDALGGAKAA